MKKLLILLAFAFLFLSLWGTERSVNESVG